MAKRPGTGALSEQLNDAVESLMTRPDAPLPAVDGRLTELLRIAADLRDLPSAEFTARLKIDLQQGPQTTVRGIPAGYHAATPCLVVADPPRAIDFYKRAFNATELMCLRDPGGQVCGIL